MKTLMTILAICISYSISYSQNSAYPQSPYFDLYDIVVEGDNILSAGSCNQALYSRDGGITLNTFPISVESYKMAAVPGSNGTKAYLMSNSEIHILDSETESVIPAVINTGMTLSGTFHDIHTKGDDIIVIGSFAITRSNTNQYDFESLGEFEYASNDNIGYSSVSENFVFMSTRKGKIFKTDLNNKTTELVYDFDTDVRGIAMGTDLIGYASVNAKIFKTTDGGESWILKDGVIESLNPIAYGENIIISQNTNRLVVSTDGGETSDFLSTSGYKDIGLMNKGRFQDDGTLYLVGRAGTIAKSQDFGYTLESFNPVSKQDIQSITFDDNGNGLATAGEDVILVTSDGGNTWTDLNYQSEFEQNYIDGSALLNDGSILIGSGNGIVKIENGNSSQISTEEVTGMLYNSEKDYLIIAKYQGGDYLMKKSIDGGVTWETKGFISDYGYNIHQSSTGKIYIPGNNDEYYTSDDDGETWVTNVNPFGTYISSFSFLDEMNGLISTGNALHRTTDGGETFTQINNAYAISNLQMIAENNYLFTTAQNSSTTVYQTKNAGENWTIIDSYCSSSRASALVGDQYWLGQRGGHINVTQVDLSTGINKIDIQDLAIKNNLLRSTDLLMIDLPLEGKSSITVVNQSGQTVIAQTSTHQGEHSLRISELNSGQYFISVKNGKGVYQGRFAVVN